MESGLDPMENLSTVLTIMIIIHFAVLQLIHPLILHCTDQMDKNFQHLMINYTSVVYPLAVPVLPISSLLIYSVNYLIIVLVHTVTCLGYVEIAEFRFELLTHMTVVPQQYTLHCVSTGAGIYNITLYYNNDQHIIYNGDCENVNCIKQLLHYSNGTYDNTVTITWDTETISSGSFNQSVNGDQVYRCNVTLTTIRNRYLTVRSMKLLFWITLINY